MGLKTVIEEEKKRVVRRRVRRHRAAALVERAQNNAETVNFDHTIDCRCADGRFSLSARGVAVLNRCSVSSSETEVTNWMKS
jgi:hypothetical protein